MRYQLACTVVLAVTVLMCSQAHAADLPMTNADVVTLVNARMPDTAIIAAILGGDIAFDLSPLALDLLDRQGVSTRVIAAMKSESAERALGSQQVGSGASAKVERQAPQASRPIANADILRLVGWALDRNNCSSHPSVEGCV